MAKKRKMVNENRLIGLNMHIQVYAKTDLINSQFNYLKRHKDHFKTHPCEKRIFAYTV